MIWFDRTSISGANISVALRQIYSRFLLPYEKAFSSNFGNDMLDDEDEETIFFAENPFNSVLFVQVVCWRRINLFFKHGQNVFINVRLYFWLNKQYNIKFPAALIAIKKLKIFPRANVIIAEFVFWSISFIAV